MASLMNSVCSTVTLRPFPLTFFMLSRRLAFFICIIDMVLLSVYFYLMYSLVSCLCGVSLVTGLIALNGPSRQVHMVCYHSSTTLIHISLGHAHKSCSQSFAWPLYDTWCDSLLLVQWEEPWGIQLPHLNPRASHAHALSPDEMLGVETGTHESCAKTCQIVQVASTPLGEIRPILAGND